MVQSNYMLILGYMNFDYLKITPHPDYLITFALILISVQIAHAVVRLTVLIIKKKY